ncbi:MAG: YicC/YloC family endoribonuclease [Bacteroidota bacterium]
MLQSMTGFGKSEITLPDKKVIIEIKSLNAKNIDSNVKIPQFYREKEIEIRKILQDQLKRGKIDFSIFYELNEGVTASSINKETFKTYFKQVNELKEELNLGTEDILSSLLRLPDTIKTDKLEFDEKEWENIEQGIYEALEDLKQFRKQEGRALTDELHERVKNITELLDSIEPFEKERIVRLRERISKNLEELKISETDNNRFEQEMIYYLEKLDISEEKTRLANHCRYFLETISNGDEAGKKLAFIGQEMGREINTLGSKASESNIQHIVVKMKDELEKIKEQTLNIL